MRVRLFINADSVIPLSPPPPPRASAGGLIPLRVVHPVPATQPDAPTMQPLKRQLPAHFTGGSMAGKRPMASHPHQHQMQMQQMLQMQQQQQQYPEVVDEVYGQQMQAPMYNFGQEFSFTVLDRREIEAKWTG